MSKILVAFFSKTGTTGEYAQVLARAFIEEGHEAEAQPFERVGSLDGYDAVVLGAPINGMQPVPELGAFIATNTGALARRPCALFTVSYMYGKARKAWDAAMQKSTATAAAAAGARTHRIFTGRLQTTSPFLMRLIFGIPKDLPLDRRDPVGMTAWATVVSDALSLAGS